MSEAAIINAAREAGIVIRRADGDFISDSPVNLSRFIRFLARQPYVIPADKSADRIEALEAALRLAHEWLDPTEIPDADYCIIRAALASETDKGIPMNALVFIAPHERHAAIEAYRDRLTAEQIDEIEEAPEGAIVQLNFGIQSTRVIIIEEG